MKKILKVLFGILLVLGCSGGVFLDSSGMFVKSAWADDYTLADGYSTPGGSSRVTIKSNVKIKKIRCLGLTLEGVHYIHTVVYDQNDKDTDIFYKGGNGSNTDSLCKTYVNTLIANAKAKDIEFIFDTSASVVKTEGEFTFREWSESAGAGARRGSSGSTGSGSSSGSNTGNDASGSNSGGNAGGSGAPKMNVLKMCEGKEGEESIKCVLNLVVNIMTYGIGVLGVVGIVLSGIQYITSQGDPVKMTKAKNRIIQVVIGLVIYAVMYSALVFLVPGFSTDIMGG